MIADRLIRRHVGVAAGIVDLHTDQVAVEVRGSGITPDSLFEIGSITKTMTALTLAVLAEDGTVRLTTPLRELLPRDEGAQPRRDRDHAGAPRSAHLRPAALAVLFWHDLKVVEFQRGNPYAMDEAAC